MTQLNVQSRRQLALDLGRELKASPITQGSEALLQALADLLLEALGKAGEQQIGERGEVHEREDHA